MSDFGGTLRQARERRGITLRQIATRTKISMAALEALERNDISKLPGGIFSRAIVRSYAGEVGLNPYDTVQAFLDRFGEEPGEPPQPARAIPAEEIAFERRKRRDVRVFLAAVAAMLVLSAAIAYLVLRNRPDTETPYEAAAAGSGSPAVPARAPEVAVPSAPQPTAPEPPSATPGAMRLAVHATAVCWVSVQADGTRVLARTLQPGQRETFEVRDTAVISVGDAGAFEFTVDGRPGRALGRRGEVRTVRFTRETVDEYLR